MTDRPTPETDAVKFQIGDSNHFAVHVVHARRLERERDEARESLELYKAANSDLKRIARERDEARDAAEKAKAYKRVLKEDNAKLRRELDELNKRLVEVCQYGVVCTIEREDLHKELDEARDDARNLLREIFNLTQIGDPHPADLPMKALKAIAEMIDEHLKEARK